MQITNVMIFGGVLILVILLMTMSDNIVPYARSSSTLNEYVYEGMTNKSSINKDIIEIIEARPDEDLTKRLLHVVKKPNTRKRGNDTYSLSTVLGIIKQYKNPSYPILIQKLEERINETAENPSKIELDEDTMTTKPKEEAFTNISDIPVKTIDVFSTSVGSPTCVGKSSGLSNSTGALCLSDNMTQMLQTRGGNSTGPDSQIGGQ